MRQRGPESARMRAHRRMGACIIWSRRMNPTSAAARLPLCTCSALQAQFAACAGRASQEHQLGGARLNFAWTCDLPPAATHAQAPRRPSHSWQSFWFDAAGHEPGRLLHVLSLCVLSVPRGRQAQHAGDAPCPTGCLPPVQQRQQRWTGQSAACMAVERTPLSF